MDITLRIPWLNDSIQDFYQLAQLWSQVVNAYNQASFRFDFSSCGFLRPNAVAFLGGLAKLIQYRGGRVWFDTNTIQPAIFNNLSQNGFAHAMGFGYLPWGGNSIPYREDIYENQNAIVQYLKQIWLGRGWVNVSPALANGIAGQMWEIYTNAFEHSQTPIGVFSCGQHFPNIGELILAVADFGVGIPSNVRFHYDTPDIRGGDAMRWAFARGNSTSRRCNFSRGVGLDLLREFIRLNQGHLEIYSHDGYARVDSQGESYENLPLFFEGTLVIVRLVCDDSFYRLSNEQAASPFF